VHGGFRKLLAAVKADYPGRTLITFSNNRLSTGATYEKSGFTLLSEQAPSYWYTDGEVRVWRFKCKRINTPEIIGQFPTEKLQAAGGVFSRMYLGHDKPMYQIHDYGHRKWSILL
jgi:hypothetical protein